MGAVLQGFAVVWALILVGMLVARTGALGPTGGKVLSRVAFSIGSPTLIFVTLIDSDPGLLLGAPMVVAISSALVTALVVALIGALLLRRGFVDTVIMGISSSVCNAANMGFPIALYVLGDIAHAAPVLLFQLAIYTPLYLMALDAGTRGARPSLGSVLGAILRNPITIASLLGLLVALSGLTIPADVLVPVEQLAGLSIPAMLLAFGISLVDQPPSRNLLRGNTDTVIAAIAKLLFMPGVAWLVGGPVLGLQGSDLFAVVVMASLPTAQNIFVIAARYEAGQKVARDTVLVTTVLSVVVVGGASALLG